RLVMGPIGAGREGGQFKQHPNAAKFAATGGVNGEAKLKDPVRAFPVGKPPGRLNCRWESKDESGAPLSINYLSSPVRDDTCKVNIEWELEDKRFELQNAAISI
ncbi:hypothetical protein BDV93DRAFT_415122, partial [Ceratobasidium sp. AG-I]